MNPKLPESSEEMDHEGQRSYAGKWDDEPKAQPPSSASGTGEAGAEDVEPSIAIDAEDDLGEFDENLVGDKRPRPS